MDAFSILSRCVHDEALRYLYVLSLQAASRRVMLAVLVGVAGALLAALAARARSATTYRRPVRLCRLNPSRAIAVPTRGSQ